MIRWLVSRWKLRRALRRLTPEQRVAFDTALSIAEIRSTFALFGHDLSDWTDEEVEQGVYRVAQTVAASGIPAADAASALAALARAEAA